MTCFFEFRRWLKYFLGLHEVGQIKFILMARSEGILEDIIFLSLYPRPWRPFSSTLPSCCKCSYLWDEPFFFPRRSHLAFPLFFYIPFWFTTATHPLSPSPWFMMTTMICCIRKLRGMKRISKKMFHGEICLATFWREWVELTAQKSPLQMMVRVQLSREHGFFRLAKPLLNMFETTCPFTCFGRRYWRCCRWWIVFVDLGWHIPSESNRMMMNSRYWCLAVWYCSQCRTYHFATSQSFWWPHPQPDENVDSIISRDFLLAVSIPGLFENCQTHRIHVLHIFTYIYHKFKPSMQVNIPVTWIRHGKLCQGFWSFPKVCWEWHLG